MTSFGNSSLSVMGAKEMLRKQWKRFSKSKLGATAIEYGLIAAGIAIVMSVAMAALGPKLTSTFKSVTDALV